METIKALIIDDEPLARELIRNYLKNSTDIEILGECENGFTALQSIQQHKPDLIFLDIQMPKISGFELLEVLDEKPHIIFTTAFDQYAIKAFEMNAIDYLLKPFSKDRFDQALQKVRTQIRAEPKLNKQVDELKSHLDQNENILERVVVRHGSKINIIPLDKIWYLEAQDDYVLVCSEIGNFLKDKTMKYYETHLPQGEFIRIHRSHIVAVAQIESVEQYSKDTHLVKLKNGTKLKTSAQGYKRLREIF
ncbi:LytR/AlgR family response regulator transcription factor [Bacteroidota bacterium]